MTNYQLPMTNFSNLFSPGRNDLSLVIGNWSLVICFASSGLHGSDDAIQAVGARTWIHDGFGPSHTLRQHVAQFQPAAGSESIGELHGISAVGHCHELHARLARAGQYAF